MDRTPLETEIARALRDLEEGGLRRRLRAAPGPGPRTVVDGREALSFASNDYLGLAADPRLAAAAARTAAEEGSGAGAARLVTGNRPSHEALERETAAFKGTEAALLFGSGYAANVSILPALCGPGDLVVSDRLNHASLIDGGRLARAEVAVTPHRDAAAVRAALGRGGFRRRLVVTEGLFSMEGDLGPLADLCSIVSDYDALLVVDDAHGHGVLGPEGRGALAAAGIEGGARVLQVGTFGKAFGGYGAFAAWTRDGVDLLLHRARGFVFSTALPPPVAAADREGLRIARAEPERRRTLRDLAVRLRRGLAAAGVEPPPGETPIVPVAAGTPEAAVRASGRLLERGFWVPAIRPPTVPEGTSRLRISLSALHREEDVDRLAAATAEALRG